MKARRAEVLSTERTLEDGVPSLEVKVDLGGDDVTKVDDFAPPGEDSVPLPGDEVLLVESAGEGEKAVSGYADPKNPGTAEPGETRRYSRQPDGALAVEYWLKGNGDCVIKGYVPTGKLLIDWPGQVIIKCDDIRVGDETASREIACVGDMIAGTLRGLCASPGSPLLPVPPATPSPTGGVPFVGQIISGTKNAKAK